MKDRVKSSKFHWFLVILIKNQSIHFLEKKRKIFSWKFLEKKNNPSHFMNNSSEVDLILRPSRFWVLRILLLMNGTVAETVTMFYSRIDRSHCEREECVLLICFLYSRILSFSLGDSSLSKTNSDSLRQI